MSLKPRDGLTVEYTDAAGLRRRVRYEPLSGGGYERVVERYTGCKWVPTGREPIDDVVIDEGGVVLP